MYWPDVKNMTLTYIQRSQARQLSVILHAPSKLSSHKNNFDNELSPERWAPKARAIFFSGYIFNEYELCKIFIRLSSEGFPKRPSGSYWTACACKWPLRGVFLSISRTFWSISRFFQDFFGDLIDFRDFSRTLYASWLYWDNIRAPKARAKILKK